MEQSQYVTKIREQPEIAVLLGIIRMQHEETYYHSIYVAEITYRMLQHMNYDEDTKYEIVKGALLHDVGKAFMPLNIMQISKTLSSTEFDIMKIHATLSYQVVSPIASDIVKNICLYHHEKINGCGYVSGIALAQIPEEALLVQVADIFDALTNRRSYKEAYSKSDALAIMQKDAEELKLDDGYLTILKKVVDVEEEVSR